MNAPAHIEASALPADLSRLSKAELRKLENRIARQYAGRTPWEIVVWAFGNLIVWLSLWPLVLFEVINAVAWLRRCHDQHGAGLSAHP